MSSATSRKGFSRWRLVWINVGFMLVFCWFVLCSYDIVLSYVALFCCLMCYFLMCVDTAFFDDEIPVIPRLLQIKDSLDDFYIFNNFFSDLRLINYHFFIHSFHLQPFFDQILQVIMYIYIWVTFLITV